MFKNVRRFVVISDTHGDLQDDKAVAAMLDFVKAWKPEVRVHAGDAWDFAALRRGASEQEKRAPIEADIKAGVSLMKRFRPTHYLRGNHCERAYDLAKSDDAKMASFAKTITDRIEASIGKAKMLPYDKRKGVLTLGKLKILHGFSAGPNAARIMAMTFGSCLFGHVHSIDCVSVPGIEKRVGMSIGCLCSDEMDYARAHLAALRQRLGFAYGFLFPNGEYQTFQAECINGSWYMPSEFRCITPR